MRRTSRNHGICWVVMLAFLAGTASAPAAPPRPPAVQYSSPGGWKPLFNGNNLAGWKYRNPNAKKVWVVCDDVRIDSQRKPCQAPWPVAIV